MVQDANSRDQFAKPCSVYITFMYEKGAKLAYKFLNGSKEKKKLEKEIAKNIKLVKSEKSEKVPLTK